MSISFTASDVGFETKQEPLDLSKTIELGGFSFPKELPQPAFLEENITRFTSDLVDDHNKDVLRTIIPSHGTATHCIIYPSSQIPEPDSFLLQQDDSTSIQERIGDNSLQLSNLKKQRQEALVNGDTDRRSQISSEMNDIYSSIVRDRLLVRHLSTYQSGVTAPNNIYLKEIQMMIYTLEEAAANHLGSEKESQLQADISLLNSSLANYVNNPSNNSERDLVGVYHTIRKKY